MTYPFPPDRIDFRTWICPGVFVALLVLALVQSCRRSKNTRYTIVLLAIVGTFCFCLMLPKIQGAREAASRTQCRINLTQIGDAILDWHKEHGRLPEAVTVVHGQQPVSWRIALLPYLALEQTGFAAGYDPARTWDDAANLALALRRPAPYVCPTNPKPKDDSGRYFTAYVLMTGPGTPLPPQGPLTIKEITDGQAQTLLVGEACGLGIIWTEPRDADVSVDEIGINRPGPAQDRSAGILSSYHVGGTSVLMADGSVTFLSDRIDEQTLRALTTASAGDTASDF
jgi:prepilin-type processing-associated H-X9-DG protein